MRRLIALVVLVLLVALGVWAVRTLPWWALVIGLVALAVAGKFLLKRLLRKLFLMPFKAKGAVLRGATATVHSVGPAEEVPGNFDPENPPGPLAHYLMEATITPQESNGTFQLWEVGELRLARIDAVLRPESDDADDDDGCEIRKCQILTDGAWFDDEGMKYSGPQRLRLWFAADPAVKELKFRYYFEEFGHVRLPVAQLA